jgi:ATP-dependent protease ClpP protease subunit
LITSVGGDMNAAFALIAVIKGSAIPVRTIVVGEASSAAFCIFMAGEQRVITPYASLMSHCFSTSVDGHFHDLKNAMDEMNSYNSKMIDLYQEFTGLDKKTIKSKFLSHKDAYISAEDAIKYHMADLISDLK